MSMVSSPSPCTCQSAHYGREHRSPDPKSGVYAAPARSTLRAGPLDGSIKIWLPLVDDKWVLRRDRDHLRRGRGMTNGPSWLEMAWRRKFHKSKRTIEEYEGGRRRCLSLSHKIFALVVGCGAPCLVGEQQVK
ncbi:hypothetical protein GWI33_006337 [Rhynchophorus ferrugineus]|uniref:Uncharacterized protein n=1 Tax=Rhynchophorus ferrugineus TaxID=354439 RepID=A0A834IIV9_RHYFE|nr:hypothetical protein GWI33_006337 [Rhynchophorus ferrugineus]